MHPNDACEHGTALPLCKKGCIEKLALAAENNIMAIRHVLNERHALRENLTATQNRCTDLLNENRRLNKELSASDATVSTLGKAIATLTCRVAELEDEINEQRGDRAKTVDVPPVLSPITDPFDNDVVLDGATAAYRESKKEETPGVTLAAYAQKNGHKATEVLMKLLAMGVAGVHINTVLDEETMKTLDKELPKKSPFPSPHKQPPFQPRSSHSGRGIRYD